LLGALLAFSLRPLWDLETRWLVVIVTGVFLVSLSLVLIRHFGDLLLIALMCSLPLAGFAKWMFLDDFPQVVKDGAPLSGAVGIGLTDFLVLGLYLAWFIRIFVTRVDPLPRLHGIDWLVLLLIAFSALSLMGDVPSLRLGLYAMEHLVKHAMIYFYVSRNFQRYHIRWWLGAVFGAILLETGVALIQSQTGRGRGLMFDKGRGSDLLDAQYAVPGIENVVRALGTTYDSHSLCLFLAMILLYPFVLAFARYLGWRRRLLCGTVLALGMAAIAVTFARAGWISFLAALVVAWAVYLLKWGETHILPGTVLALLLLLIPAPWIIRAVAMRLDAPKGLITIRFEQYKVGLDIWLSHPLLGVGAGNYLKTTEVYPYHSEDVLESPVHNMFLFLAAEVGLLGVVSFYAIIFAALRRLWRVIRAHQDPDCRVALAAFAGLIAYVLGGLSDPLFREPVVYLTFWFTVGLSVALTRPPAEDPGQNVVPRAEFSTP
jgi:O-antigen ligase